jgi:lipoate-protein ligase A
MDYYFLDAVTWENSQALYHAAARLGREALFILRPATPYVCLGFHQDARQEIDLDFTNRNNIPVFRREVGGGAVYLDGQQLFFQLIIRQDRPGVPANIMDFYRIFLRPVVDTYRDFGVDAKYRPVNDIMAKDRKISGTGAAQIENMRVLVGNFLQDFDYEMMSRCLKVPDEKFRDKVYKTMFENLTTFKRETGEIPTNDALAQSLRIKYEKMLGEFTPKTPDQALIQKADQLMAEMNTSEWLFVNDRRNPDGKQVKIAEGVYVIQKMLKTPGGLIRVTAINRNGRLKDVHFSGDFFFYPSDRLIDLEEALQGASADTNAIERIVKDFYMQQSIVSPGVSPTDFSQVLVG